MANTYLHVTRQGNYRTITQTGKYSSNADDIAAWDRSNHIAKMQIFMTLEHAVANLYDDKSVASELWSALQAHFEGKGLVAVVTLAA